MDFSVTQPSALDSLEPNPPHPEATMDICVPDGSSGSQEGSPSVVVADIHPLLSCAIDLSGIKVPVEVDMLNLPASFQKLLDPEIFEPFLCENARSRPHPVARLVTVALESLASSLVEERFPDAFVFGIGPNLVRFSQMFPTGHALCPSLSGDEWNKHKQAIVSKKLLTTTTFCQHTVATCVCFKESDQPDRYRVAIISNSHYYLTTAEWEKLAKIMDIIYIVDIDIPRETGVYLLCDKALKVEVFGDTQYVAAIADGNKKPYRHYLFPDDNDLSVVYSPGYNLRLLAWAGVSRKPILANPRVTQSEHIPDPVLSRPITPTMFGNLKTFVNTGSMNPVARSAPLDIIVKDVEIPRVEPVMDCNPALAPRFVSEGYVEPVITVPEEFNFQSLPDMLRDTRCCILEYLDNSRPGIINVGKLEWSVKYALRGSIRDYVSRKILNALVDYLWERSTIHLPYYLFLKKKRLGDANTFVMREFNFGHEDVVTPPGWKLPDRRPDRGSPKNRSPKGSRDSSPTRRGKASVPPVYKSRSAQAAAGMSETPSSASSVASSPKLGRSNSIFQGTIASGSRNNSVPPTALPGPSVVRSKTALPKSLTGSNLPDGVTKKVYPGSITTYTTNGVKIVGPSRVDAVVKSASTSPAVESEIIIDNLQQEILQLRAQLALKADGAFVAAPVCSDIPADLAPVGRDPAMGSIGAVLDGIDNVFHHAKVPSPKAPVDLPLIIAAIAFGIFFAPLGASAACVIAMVAYCLTKLYVLKHNSEIDEQVVNSTVPGRTFNFLEPGYVNPHAIRLGITHTAPFVGNFVEGSTDCILYNQELLVEFTSAMQLCSETVSTLTSAKQRTVTKAANLGINMDRLRVVDDTLRLWRARKHGAWAVPDIAPSGWSDFVSGYLTSAAWVPTSSQLVLGIVLLFVMPQLFLVLLTGASALGTRSVSTFASIRAYATSLLAYIIAWLPAALTLIQVWWGGSSVPPSGL